MASEKLKSYFEFSLDTKNRMNGLCKLCQHNYKDLYGIYSNFLKHLKRKHATEYKKICFISTNDDLCEEINNTDDEQQLSNDLRQINNKQHRINFSLAKNLIIKCNLPLNTIENVAFREFIKDCYPKWQPISSKNLKSKILPSINDRICKLIYETLEKVNYLTLTIDVWSDRRGRSFLGITCHFIDDSMMPQAFLIDFVRMKAPHTSENIQCLTENVLDRFNIKQKVYRIITDNASSMIKAYKFGLNVAATDEKLVLNNDDQYFDMDNFQMIDQTVSVESVLRLSCFAHTLQLTIHDGLQKNMCISKILEKCELLAELAHKSSKISDILDEINKHINKPNITRWNSDYMLVKSILSINRNELETILSLTDNLIQFSNNDFIVMEEIIDILEPFYEISLKCQADKVVTISLVVPSIVHLICHLRSIRESLSFCHLFVEQLQSSIETRFAGIIHRSYDQDIKRDDPFNDPIYFMTTVLDPTFKFFWIHDLHLPINIVNRLKQTIIQLILDEINTDLIQQRVAKKPPNEMNTSSIPATQHKTKRMKLFVYDEHCRSNKNLIGSTISNPSLELEAYLNDSVPTMFSEYWLRSPLISLKQLVTRIFSVQASSAPVERIFSYAGLILTSRRTRLNEQLFKDIVFLKANQCLL